MIQTLLITEKAWKAGDMKKKRFKVEHHVAL